MRWAAGGFLGGFLLCYLLLTPFRPQPPAPGLLTSATPSTTWPPVPAVATNIQLPEVRIASPDRWVDQMPGMPPGPRPPGYSLDVIDTRYQPPPLPEKP
jgi:hypothetical protein